MTIHPSDPQPRRAFVEPANGVDQLLRPIRHTPQGLDRAGNPFPAHQVPRAAVVASLAAVGLIIVLAVLAAVGRA